MKIYHELRDYRSDCPRAVVALGMFDGVHIGHARIIRRAVELAKRLHGTSVVFTFLNHPLSVLAPGHEPPAIASRTLCAQEIAKLGADVLVMIPFDRELAAWSADAFLARLQADFAPRYVVTGPNYTFGRGGVGDRAYLAREGAAYGFETIICEAVTAGGALVSSTRIRGLLAEGNLDQAEAFLGRPFSLLGPVVHGDARGRTIGFPTANFDLPDRQVSLPNGAYAAAGLYAGRRLAGMANIGDNPTFGGCKRRLEVHFEDFHEDVYGEMMEIQFLAHLRGEVRFDGVEALKRQLQKDREHARAVFAARFGK